jgi:hypothetical protein
MKKQQSVLKEENSALRKKMIRNPDVQRVFEGKVPSYIEEEIQEHHKDFERHPQIRNMLIEKGMDSIGQL